MGPRDGLDVSLEKINILSLLRFEHYSVQPVPQSLHQRQNHDSYLTKYDNMMYLLNAIGLAPGVSSTVHTYTQTVHRTTQ